MLAIGKILRRTLPLLVKDVLELHASARTAARLHYLSSYFTDLMSGVF